MRAPVNLTRGSTGGCVPTGVDADGLCGGVIESRIPEFQPKEIVAPRANTSLTRSLDKIADREGATEDPRPAIAPGPRYRIDSSTRPASPITVAILRFHLARVDQVVEERNADSVRARGVTAKATTIGSPWHGRDRLGDTGGHRRRGRRLWRSWSFGGGAEAEA